jgi:hypothetical protein
MKSGLAPRMISSRDGPRGGPRGAGGRQAGLTPRCETDVKCDDSERAAGERWPEARGRES